MKKVIFLMALCALSFAQDINAQAACEGVNVSAFPKRQQSGAYDYYGVRVAMAQPYSQNITVVGTITEQGGQNVVNMFTLTVTAGEIFARTSETFYSVPNGRSVVVNVESIDPCPVNQQTNLFDNLLANPNPTSIQTFSAELASMDFRSFQINSIQGTTINLKITLGEVYIQNELYSVSGWNFAIVKSGNTFVISNDQSQMSLEYSTDYDQYTMISGLQRQELSSVDLSSLSIPIYSELLIDIAVLHEFYASGLERTYPPVGATTPNARRRVGTAIGFWWNDADAHLFCL